MPTLYQGKNPGEYLVHEESKDMSREKVMLASGENLVDGSVLAKKTADGKYYQLAPAAADGTEVAKGILRENVDATAGDASVIIHNFHCKVRDENLTWPAGITAGQKTTALSQLSALNIKVQL